MILRIQMQLLPSTEIKGAWATTGAAAYQHMESLGEVDKFLEMPRSHGPSSRWSQEIKTLPARAWHAWTHLRQRQENYHEFEAHLGLDSKASPSRSVNQLATDQPIKHLILATRWRNDCFVFSSRQALMIPGCPRAVQLRMTTL